MSLQGHDRIGDNQRLYGMAPINPSEKTAQLLEKWDREIAGANQELHCLENQEISLELLEVVLNDEARRTALFAKFRDNPYAMTMLFKLSEGEGDGDLNDIVWNLGIVAQDMEIEFLSHLDVLVVAFILEVDNRKSALFEKYTMYKNDPQALVAISQWLTPDERRDLWENHLVPLDLEIAFLWAGIQVAPETPYIPEMPNQNQLLKRLIKKCEDDPFALAAIWINLTDSKKDDLWDHVIVPRKIEIRFLSNFCQFENNGAMRSMLERTLRRKKHPHLITSKTRLKKMTKRYKHTPEVFARIPEFLQKKNRDEANYITYWPLYTDAAKIQMWDEQIVSHNLEIAFLVQMSQHDELREGVKTTLQIAGRVEAMLEKYKDIDESIKVINQFFGL